MGVRLASMHQVKGLEFDHMVIASVNKGTVPLPTAAYVMDWPESSVAATAERALLVCSRYAREEGVGAIGPPGTKLICRLRAKRGQST